MRRIVSGELDHENFGMVNQVHDIETKHIHSDTEQNIFVFFMACNTCVQLLVGVPSHKK